MKQNRRLKKKPVIIMISILLFIIICLLYPYISRRSGISSASEEYIVDENPKSLKDWQDINPDVRFLLHFDTDKEEFSIPVIVTDNGDYYMLHNVYKQYDTMGSIFIDTTESPLETSNNWLIYGHSSKTKNWSFTFLKNYMNKAYFDNHTSFTLEDENGTSTYLINYISQFNFENDDEDIYTGWYQNMFSYPQDLKEMIDESKPYIINQRDSIIYSRKQYLTLITCDMQYNDARFVIFAAKQ